MVCKGEDEVLNPGNTDAMIEYLLPKATVVTPNLFEAGQLSGLGKLTSIENMKKADIIFNQGAQNVIIKGGKALDQDKSYDLYYDGNTFYQLTTDMFQQSYNHGAGLHSPKHLLLQRIKNGRKMNDFVGPVDHGAYNRVEHIDVDVTEV